MDLSNNLLIIKDNYKRNRKSNAIKLPPELNDSIIPKYVVYYKECYNKDKMLFREFFKIEKHPSVKNNKIYTSSKSNKIKILDKLEQIKIILKNIENTENTQNTENTENTDNTEKIILPKYISLKKINIKNSNEIKYCLVYDKKTENNRYTFKLLCNKNISINDNLKIFINKINEKFS